MTAEELMKRFSLQAHVENGAFVELHYEHKGPGRAASGSIYYYVAPGEKTLFHQIDCDEYWCYSCGSPLEIWQVDPEDGSVSVSMLGVEEGCEPLTYIKKGTIFAAKHPCGCGEGTFLSCITVPRFQSEGFRLIDSREMLEKYPESVIFFE